ncbi:MAG: terminase small subunit [Leptotrichia wadei]|uniref:terminase small subunit n=1 Tax=Leptotrichia wadei TaxID=157687 RepID=UPI0020604391|nr:terminase small subunit [Leptotrichia wadei]MBS6019092.1 terminase small subunit [Leptotrichia wadei]DAN01337.1 MAG TPA: Terminase small subunit [Caudoviricetes sp.]DAX90415.1 MAG TPA: Terminase small subunit [Caudoviricetes sp.]
MKLTEKQKRFADYYIETGNATESARRAGYKGKNLNNVASENLAKVGVKSYIDEKLKIMQDERTASAKEVLEFLTKSMRGELDEEIVVVEGTGDGTSEARKIKKQIGLRERIKSAELLGKRYRLFTDKVEVEGVVPVMIVGESELEE